MFEDLAFSMSSKPLPAEIATLVKTPSGSQPPVVGKRRPRPPNLSRSNPCPPAPNTPRPPVPPQPQAGMAASTLRPLSVGELGTGGADEWRQPALLGGLGAAAVAAAGAEADAARLRSIVLDLQARCERQAQELMELKHPGKSDLFAGEGSLELRRRLKEPALTRTVRSLPPREHPSSRQEGTSTETIGCQTDERVFAEQLDAVHREAAQRGKEIRRLQETVRTLRDELKQEKTLADQYRMQVELLEEQLRGAMQKQQEAEGERALAEWRARDAEGAGPGGRASRASTPRLFAPRVKTNAWAEAGAISRGQIRGSQDGGPGEVGDGRTRSASALSSHSSRPVAQAEPGQCQRGGRLVGPAASRLLLDGEEEDPLSSEEEEEDSEELAVFHPPPVGAGRYAG